MNSTADSQQQFERLLVVPPTIDIPDDVNAFYAQPRENQLEQILTVGDMYYPEINRRFFSGQGMAWVAVGIPTGEIIKAGAREDEMPDKISEVKTLAQQAITRCLPMVFRRPVMITSIITDRS